MPVSVLNQTQNHNAYVLFIDDTKKILGKWNEAWLKDLLKTPLQSDFKGKYKECLLLYPPSGNPKRVLIVGAGKTSLLTLHRIRALGAQVSAFLKDKGVFDKINVLMPQLGKWKTAEVAEAFQLGSDLYQFSFRDFKTDSSDDEKNRRKKVDLSLIVSDRKDLKTAEASASRAEKMAEGVNWARRLILLSAEQLNPSTLAREAEKMVATSPAKSKLKITVWTEKELQKNKFGGVLNVGKGSDLSPRFIIVEYFNAKKSEKPIVLVGKGVTFDSGGLSLKPPQAQETMKYDMAGSASVLASVKILAALEAKVNVVALVPAVENLPSGRAMKPGDIITMASGKTVEVLNTDAEGRLILADALHYGSTHYQPQAMIDVATLTGSCALAVGEAAAGVFSNDRKVLDRLTRASMEVGENLWPLPNFDDFYADLLKSDVADMKNIGTREAGASSASIFLRHFVKDGTPWAHLDIAGCGWYDAPRDFIGMRGPSGIPIRTLVQFVENSF